jgi:pyruvate dehydrogenase E2 component (dihydrolipoamide acetyltransferase)
MTIKITMPALSPTMTEGAIAKWHKREGEAVKSGDVIAEIETDKATVEVEASDDGILGKILQPAGTKGIKVNETIAILLEEGESASALQGIAAPKPAAPAVAPAAALQRVVSTVSAVSPPPAAPKMPAAPAPKVGNGADRVFVSPLARRMAEKAGLDLHALRGSGPQGRIVRADIESALKGGALPAAAISTQAAASAAAPSAAAPSAPRPAPAAAKPSAAPELVPPYTEIPHTTIRRVIAKRLTEAKRDAPHFYLSVDCQVDKLLALRKELNDRAPKEGGYKLSVNDFVLRAVALGMKKVPAANASWTENAIRLYKGVDISVAVSIPNGLITPIIRAADTKGLAQISNEMRALAEKARAGKLQPEEYQGGTVSVSNLGMYGVRDFAAVINPPQGCILAVGAAGPRPVVKDGALAIATVMTCTLSVDHRVVDGAIGAEFLAAFKALVEDPVTMLL